MKTFAIILAGLLVLPASATFGQSSHSDPSHAAASQEAPPAAGSGKHHGRSAAGEYGSGAGEAGRGAAGGVGNAAKGVGDFATLHPAKGTKTVARGGKDVGVGAVKGTGKIVKGTGKLFTHPF